MKLAVIGNDAGLIAVKRAGLSYHMALGQHLAVDSAYFEFYRKERDRGAFIIVDNGASEGSTLPFAAVAERAYILGADEVVLPDKVGDMEETIRLTLDPNNYKIIAPKQRFIVPQGATTQEWKECLWTILSNVQVGTIGLVRYLSQYEPQGRLKLVHWLRSERLTSKLNIHILGLRYHPLQEARDLAKVKYIRGIDTALPIAMAQQGRILHEEERFPFNWDAQCDLNAAQHNIDRLKDICNGK